MPIGLTYEFTYRAQLKPPVDTGRGPIGQRMYFQAIGGDPIEGDRISGRVLTGGGDWLAIGTDGWGRLDVRAMFETHDGAIIYAQYHGLLELNDTVNAAMASGAATDWDDQYFRSLPRLQTGDERYDWVNRTVFVGEGRAIEGLGVEYRVYRVD